MNRRIQRRMKRDQPRPVFLPDKHERRSVALKLVGVSGNFLPERGFEYLHLLNIQITFVQCLSCGLFEHRAFFCGDVSPVRHRDLFHRTREELPRFNLQACGPDKIALGYLAATDQIV